MPTHKHDDYIAEGDIVIHMLEEYDDNKSIWHADETHYHTGYIYHGDITVAEIYGGIYENIILADPDTQAGRIIIALDVLEHVEVMNKKLSTINIKGGNV